MVNGIRTIYFHGLDKGLGSRFCVGFGVRLKTPEDSRRMHWTKHYEYNNEDEDISPNTLNDKNYPASSQKFRQLLITFFFFFLLYMINFEHSYFANFQKITLTRQGLKKSICL